MAAVVAQAAAWVQAQPALKAGLDAALPGASPEAHLATLAALLLATLYLLRLLSRPKNLPPTVSVLPVIGGFLKFIGVRCLAGSCDGVPPADTHTRPSPPSVVPCRGH